MSRGYTGKYCIVNLSSATSEIIEPGDEFYKDFLGGYSLGAAVIMERQQPGIDPLSPDSYLGFCSGLLTGTDALFSGRFMVVGKSPLTGGWGDANAGGFFSRELKRNGFDAVFFTGASKTPVWVSITDGQIRFHDASSLWGKEIPETEKIIKDTLGEKKAQVASIGKSGEKLSLISGIATDSARIAARSGLGAVMGSKNLKALALRSKGKIATAFPKEIKAINKKFMMSYRKSSFADRLTMKYLGHLSKLIARTGISVPATPSLIKEIYRTHGTSGLTAYSAMTGDMPIKNWAGVGYRDYTYDAAVKGSGKNVKQYQKKRYACQGCPLGCGGIIDIKKGKYKGKKGHKPEYETIGAFGGMLLQKDFDAIVELNEMCNRAGIDTISTGGTIAFAIECYENGIIDQSDTGGLELGWGRTREIIKLTEMMIDRQGFGDILADGVKKAAQRIGKNSEKYAVHAGGQELPMHDSRLDPGLAIAYECEPTPGRHTITCYLYTGLFGLKKRFPKARMLMKKAKGKDAKKIAGYAAGSFYMNLLNCCGMCQFGALTSTLPVVEYLNAVTGWNFSPDEYLRAGERALNIRKAFNVREGIRPEDHQLSKRATGSPSLKHGPLKDTTVDMDEIKMCFYDTVGWDAETGGPTRQTMENLCMERMLE